MEAPTPVSAFMHAGLVNGAAVLFAKTAPIVAGAPAALTLAALLGGITAAIGATIALVRPESKRRLGWSTVAQMGFMVLQCGCGAFAAAVIHLVAHGGYKAAAFLGVAGSIDANARARRHPARAAVPQRVAQTLTSFVPPTLGIVLAWLAVRDHLAGLPAAAFVIALAWTTGVCAARSVAERELPTRDRLLACAMIAAGIVAYVSAVVALDAWLGTALPRGTFVPAAIVATLIVAAAGVLEGAGLRPRGSDLLYTIALTEGRAVRGALRV
jgi:NADH:ubiquinone oxidoreductase subunit 5 (subunit L)/multisubunit Na+/H+ antiporter MnhA subunit